MRRIGSPLFLLLLTTGFWLVAGGVGKAQEVKFPEKSPLVSFTLPDGWLVDQEGNSDVSILDCVFSATIKFRLRLLKDTYSDADWQQKMANFIKANLDTFGFAADSLDPAAIKVTSRSLNDKIKAVCAEVKLKSLMLDEPCRLRVVGFTVDGKSMLAMCGMEESARKPAQDFDKILGSLKPIK